MSYTDAKDDLRVS